MADLQSVTQDVQALVRKLEQDKHHHSKDYNEALIAAEVMRKVFTLKRSFGKSMHIRKPIIHKPLWIKF